MVCAQAQFPAAALSPACHVARVCTHHCISVPVLRCAARVSPGAGAVPGGGADEAHPRGAAGARRAAGAGAPRAAAPRRRVARAHRGAAPPQVPPLHHAHRAAAHAPRRQGDFTIHIL